ncbi:MAG: VanW family protein [Anaerolineales bacterium]|nr:VanW family protein [Anaerolineales bacterium]
MDFIKTRRKNAERQLLYFILAFLIGIPTAVFLLVLYVRIFFAGRIYPGVTSGETGLQSLTLPEAEIALGKVYSYPLYGNILLVDEENSWRTTPSELGLVIDLPTMAQQAMAVGRTGSLSQKVAGQIRAWINPVTIDPVLIVDQRVGGQLLGTLEQTIYQPARNASVTIDGVQASAVPGQTGRQLDFISTQELVLEAVETLENSTIQLPVESLQPEVMDASGTAALTNSLLAEPFAVNIAEDTLQLQPNTLAQMITFEIEGDEDPSLVIGLDPTLFFAFLLEIGTPYEHSAENARFIFNDDTHELDILSPSSTGRLLDQEATRLAFEEALNAGVHTADVAFSIEQPQVGDDATAEELGITELVSMRSTYFGGSSSARSQNILTASQAFHGYLIPPGGILSMADLLGDISLDTGYAEAWIIFGDRTIKGVGGGVCQVSTTLFRTAFFGGYPVVERYPHAYRVGYYEQGPNSPGPGLDATVFVPEVDFRFVNDRPYWLLMETYVYGTQLVWKFYSTADGRTVEVSAPEISNEVEAEEPLYVENPDLKKGEIKQVDWEADGMDVVVHRTVYRDGEVLFSDTMKTEYEPWRAIYEYGPGTKLPKDAITEEDEN